MITEYVHHHVLHKQLSKQNMNNYVNLTFKTKTKKIKI